MQIGKRLLTKNKPADKYFYCNIYYRINIIDLSKKFDQTDADTLPKK